MKAIFLRLCCAGLAIVGITVGRANAQTFAADNANNDPYTNGWQTLDNGGTGFGPWALTNNNDTANGAFAGAFIGGAGSAAMDVNGKSFGIYANGNGVNYSIGYRALSNSLALGTVLTLKFKNTGIASGGAMGFSVFNGTNFGRTDFADMTGNARFSFYFVGGSADYVIYDGNFVTDTGIPFSSGGFSLEFSLRDANTYRFVVKSLDGLTTIGTFDYQPLLNSGSIDSFSVFNIDSGGNENAYFNQFAVQSVSLVPPEINNVQPTNGSFYLPTSTPISFNALSSFSTIATNNIKLKLNGTNVTALAFAGASTNWSVTATPTLAPNIVYTAVITVTDGNGNSATNTFQFNTWSADNMFIEAEAYNFSGGAFIANPAPGQYDTLTAVAAVAGVDFFETVDGGVNLYRTNDPVDLEISQDLTDHNNYIANTLVNWALDYVQPGEWLNFTRRIPTNTAYNVYARYSGGPTPVILLERAASATATSTNQPRAALGTIVGTDTGSIVNNYNFAPLKDFFGNLVAFRFNQLTNTLRETRIGDGYNLDYLTFIPIADTNVQRPYISAGFPFPGAGGVLPDQSISFTIANRQTTNVPGTIKLILNGADVSANLTLSNNAAGTVVTYVPQALYTVNTSNTVRATFSDNAGVVTTNDWTFFTANTLTLPSGFALASGSGVGSGFNVHISKAPDTAPSGDFAPTSARAEAQLAGLIINTNTGLPWTNEAAGPNGNGLYTETNVINYELCGSPSPDGETFTNNSPFPYVNLAPYAPCANTNGPDYFALSAVTYVQLTAGLHQWGIASDDGFRLSVGTGSTPTNVLIIDYEGGRSSGTPSIFTFIVPVTGVYPMRLLYYQGGFGASVEWYEINRTNGTPTLINSAASPVKAYLSSSAASTVVILNPHHTGTATTFNFQTQVGKTHTVQYKVNITDATWLNLLVVPGNGSTTNITDNVATNSTRFYRISTQ